MSRPSKQEHYINIAKEVAQRSTCFRVRIGSIVVKDDAIISTGYVGAPRKTKDCLERGDCLRKKLNVPRGHRYELCRSVHAEQNAIINSGRSGANLFGADMYMWASDEKGNLLDGLPCFICKKMIINAGIKRFISMMKDGSIKVTNIDDWVKDWQEKDIIDDKEQYGK